MRKNAAKMKRITVLLAAATILLLCGQAAAEKVITLSFTGDCTIGTEESTKYAPDSFNRAVEEKGYSYFFANFYDLFSQDDCTVVNCECVLSDSNDGEMSEKNFRFRGPESFVNILKEGSVEAVSLANNHSKDYGGDGLLNTMRVLEEADIGWAWDENIWVFEKDGIRIAFAGVDYGIFQRSNYIIRDKLLEMRKNGEINAVVMLIHEGKEFYPKHLGNQEMYGEYFIGTAGADLVIMHHPHVVQGIRILNNRSVFYSLGNFVFGAHNMVSRNAEEKTNSLYSLVVQARLYFSDDGVYRGQQMILYSAYDSGADPVNNYQPVRITAEQAEPVWEAIQFDTEWQLPPLQTDESGRAYAIMNYLPANETSPEDTPPEEGEPEAAQPQPGRNR